MKRYPFPRRTFLRGAGATLALPLLDAMVPTALASTPVNGAAPPTRMAFFYIPNGAHMADWTPTAEGTDFELPSILEPLAPHRQHVAVMSGLAVDNAKAKGDGPGDHARSAAAFLTGKHPVKTDGKDIRAGVSVDQIAAKYLGNSTRFPTLEIGNEAGRLAGSCDSGYSCAYSHSISWRSETHPAGKESNPQHLFDRMFGDGDSDEPGASRRRARRQSVIDMVLDDAKRLQGQVGVADRHKMDEYLQSVREVEKRVTRAQPAADELGIARPEEAPDEFSNHMRLMGDLMILAFQTDMTRICTFMVANEGSGRTYPEIEVRHGHHELSHHQGDKDKQRQISAINRYHVEQLAYIIGRMAEIPEGDSTLLHNTALVYGSAIGDGNRHNHDDLPVLVAGNGGGRITTGVHRRFKHDTPIMNLFLTLLQDNGVPVKSVGDSTGTLPLIV
jgi:hypothetical protein